MKKIIYLKEYNQIYQNMMDLYKLLGGFIIGILFAILAGIFNYYLLI